MRPDCLPLAASRVMRSADEPGNSEYSAVTHPLPLPRIHGGTRSSTDAVHNTLVRPMATSTEPGANSVKSRTNDTGRRSSTCAAVGSTGPGVGLRSRRAHSEYPRPMVATSTAPPKVSVASAITAASVMVGQRWVSTRRRTPSGLGRHSCLSSTHMTRGSFEFFGVGGLAQREVEVGAERFERPIRTGIRRVPQGPAGPLDAHRQGGRRMVGAGERELRDRRPCKRSPSPTSRQSKITSTSSTIRSLIPGAASTVMGGPVKADRPTRHDEEPLQVAPVVVVDVTEHDGVQGRGDRRIAAGWRRCPGPASSHAEVPDAHERTR